MYRRVIVPKLTDPDTASHKKIPRGMISPNGNYYEFDGTHEEALPAFGFRSSSFGGRSEMLETAARQGWIATGTQNCLSFMATREAIMSGKTGSTVKCMVRTWSRNYRDQIVVLTILSDDGSWTNQTVDPELLARGVL